MIRGPLQGQGRLGKFRPLLPLTVTVGLVAEGAAVIAVDPHGSVAVEALVRTARCIDRDLMVIDAESVALGIAVGKKASLEHLVGVLFPTRSQLPSSV